VALTAQDRIRCVELESVRERAARSEPAPAVVDYLRYLDEAPDAPLAASARQAARGLLESRPLTGIMTPGLCDYRLELIAELPALLGYSYSSAGQRRLRLRTWLFGHADAADRPVLIRSL